MFANSFNLVGAAGGEEPGDLERVKKSLDALGLPLLVGETWLSLQDSWRAHGLWEGSRGGISFGLVTIKTTTL